MSEGYKIPIYVRLRPCDSKFDFNIENHRIISFEETERKQYCRYNFERILDVTDGQEEVYEVVAKNLVKDFIAGHDVVIFAYGYTGSGKSYTIYGPEDDRGIVWRAVNDIFDIVDKKRDEFSNGKEEVTTKKKQHLTLSISFTESYQKKQYDLLKNRKLIEKGNPVTEILIKSRDRALKLINSGYNKRRVEETSMNHQSSRSHAILTIKFVQILNDAKIESRLYLADLAGSESSDRDNDSLMKETININSSLHRLKEFLRSLADKNRSIKGWRDMKGYFPSDFIDTLRGQCKMAIILNCSTDISCKNSTRRTLEFGNEIKNIKKVSHIKVKGDIYKLLASYYDQESKLWEQIYDNIKGYNMTTIDFNILKRKAENANKLRRFNTVLPKLQSFLSSGTDSPKSEELNSDQYYGDSERDTSISQEIDEISLLEFSDVSYSDPDELENTYSSYDDMSISTNNGKHDINDSFKSIDDDIILESDKSLESRDTFLNDKEISLNEREQNLDKKECDLKELEIKLEEKVLTLKDWESNLEEKEKLLEEKSATFKQIEKDLDIRVKQFNEWEENVLRKKEFELNEEYNQKVKKLNEYEKSLKLRENSLFDKENLLKELELDLKNQQTNFNEMKSNWEMKEKELDEKEKILKQKEETVEERQIKLNNTESELNAMKINLEQNISKLKDWELKLEEKQNQLNDKEKELKQKEEKLLKEIENNNLISSQNEKTYNELNLEKARLEELKETLESEKKHLMKERENLKLRSVPNIENDLKYNQDNNTKSLKNGNPKENVSNNQLNSLSKQFTLRNIIVNLVFMIIFISIGWIMFSFVHNVNLFNFEDDSNSYLSTKRYYDVLNLNTNASYNEIKKKSDMMLKKYHPDKRNNSICKECDRIYNNVILARKILLYLTPPPYDEIVTDKTNEQNNSNNTIQHDDSIKENNLNNSSNIIDTEPSQPGKNDTDQNISTDIIYDDKHNNNPNLIFDHLFENDKYYAVILLVNDDNIDEYSIQKDFDRLFLKDKDIILQFREMLIKEFDYQSGNIEQDTFFIIHKNKRIIESLQNFESLNNRINELLYLNDESPSNNMKKDNNNYWLTIREWDTKTTIGIGGVVSVILFALGNFIARVLYV